MREVTLYRGDRTVLRDIITLKDYEDEDTGDDDDNNEVTDYDDCS